MKHVFFWLTKKLLAKYFGKICALYIKEMHWFESLFASDVLEDKKIALKFF